MEHRALADKYYIKWENVCKEANDLRRKIPIKSHLRQVNYFERGKYNNSTKANTYTLFILILYLYCLLCSQHCMFVFWIYLHGALDYKKFNKYKVKFILLNEMMFKVIFSYFPDEPNVPHKGSVHLLKQLNKTPT
jgi:hypothetical protein